MAGDHFYTTSTTERDNTVANDGYHYEGIASYVYDVQQAGTAAFYRLFSPGSGDHFYTTSTIERDNAVTNDGYNSEGVACYVYDSPPSGPNGSAAFWRLFSPGSGDHFYTTSTTERDNAVTKDGYRYEGIASYGYETEQTGTTAFYRLFSPGSGDHFYTTSTTERDNAVTNDGYNSEGVACYVYDSPPSGPNGSAAFWRLFSPGSGDHFYTTSTTERDNAVANDGYHSEGVACYVYGTQPSDPTPLYRFFNDSDGDHFYTTSPTEGINAVANNGYHVENIACYVYGTMQAGSTPFYRLVLSPPAPLRIWFLWPHVSATFLVLASGDGIGFQPPGGTWQSVPAATTGVAIGVLPPAVLSAATDLATATASGAPPDAVRSQALLEAVKASGHSDVDLVVVAASPPGSPGPHPTVVVGPTPTPAHLIKWTAWIASATAFVTKLAADLLGKSVAAAPAAEATAANSAWIIEVLTWASRIATGAALFATALLIPTDAGGPGIPQAPTVSPPGGAYTGPDGGVTMIGSNGTVTTLWPPPDSEPGPLPVIVPPVIVESPGGDATFQDPGGTPVTLPVPGFTEVAGPGDGDGGGGDDGGRPEIQ